MLCHNPNKTMRFIKAMEKVYPVGSQSPQFLLQTWMANAYVTAGNPKALILFDELSVIYKEQEGGFTTFMKLSFSALKVKNIAVYRQQ
jgi:ribosomal protein L17